MKRMMSGREGGIINANKGKNTTLIIPCKHMNALPDKNTSSSFLLLKSMCSKISQTRIESVTEGHLRSVTTSTVQHSVPTELARYHNIIMERNSFGRDM